MKKRIKAAILSCILSYIKKFEGVTHETLLNESIRLSEINKALENNRTLSKNYMMWTYEIGLQLEKNGVTFDPGYYITKKKIEECIIEKEIDISDLFTK